jgi:hypothetical protein
VIYWIQIHLMTWYRVLLEGPMVIGGDEPWILL